MTLRHYGGGAAPTGFDEAKGRQSERNRTSAIGDLRIGLSGWRYPPWRGVFYPEGLPQRRELEYASRQVDSIEINGSFYSMQRPAYYARWHDETPDDFVFSVKGPRYITHMLKLDRVATPLANFLASGIANLGEKLGPILWQLPPTFRYDERKLDAFFRLLPRDTDRASALARRHDGKVRFRARLAYGRPRRLRHALEIRHDSFIDPSFVALLREHGIALVVADTAGRWPLREDVTSDFVYVRLHGDEELYVSGYSDAALAHWAARLDAWRRGGEPADARRIVETPGPRCAARDVYCYFDNDAKVMAPRDALSLAARMGVAQRTRGSAVP